MKLLNPKLLLTDLKLITKITPSDKEDIWAIEVRIYNSNQQKSKVYEY